jgi:class 3 adenylate cyclase
VAEERVQRRLAAILAADVAGYSRLMHDDEEATHARFTALLKDAIEPGSSPASDHRSGWRKAAQRWKDGAVKARPTWIRRILLFRPGLRFIPTSLFVASGLTSQATMRRTSLGLSGFVRGCGWPGYRRGEGLGIRAHMSDPTAVSRKLVAVFAADVEGYSRLMGADEVGTLKGLTERRAILDRFIGDHGGRIANTAGDSVLAEFGSAVEAVQCAVETQTALAEANAGVPPDRRINFRIGVHIGDVMVRAGDLFGDGVNIAARLQTLANPGAGAAAYHPRSCGDPPCYSLIF